MRFQAKALSKDGVVRALSLEAADAADARQVAAAQGLALLSIKPEFGLRGWPPRTSKFPLALFSQELKVLLAAGVSLVEALDTLSERESKPQLRAIITRLNGLIKEGYTLADAMERIPEAFPQLYSASVRASETSGEIVAALDRYLAYQGQIDLVRKKVLSASVYPAMIILFGGAVLLFMLGYVVPRFSAIYSDRGEAVSQASRLLLLTGQFIAAHGYTLAGGAAAIVAGGWLWLRQPSARAWLLSRLHTLPALGTRVHTFHLARLYRTLGMLLRGGIPIAAALEMASGILEAGLRRQLAAAKTDVREGQPLSEAFQRNGLSTAVAYRLIRVAEETGSMSEMLESAAAFHEEELARDVDLFTRLFEPALMMVIGLMVGAIVLLMYMPIFELAGAVQ